MTLVYQMTRRPDQDKFDQFVAPLEKFDASWVSFERAWGFTLERNPHRKPGRILRKEVRAATHSTRYLIELYLEPCWFDTEFSDALPYTFVACAYFELFAEKTVFWKAATDLISGQPLDRIARRLPELFAEGNNALEKFTPEYMQAFGEKLSRINVK